MKNTTNYQKQTLKRYNLSFDQKTTFEEAENMIKEYEGKKSTARLETFNKIIEDENRTIGPEED